MQSRLPRFSAHAEQTPSTSWQVNEALVSAWQHVGVTNLDQGFEQLLRMLLNLMKAHFLRCTLEDLSERCGRTTITSQTVGLRMVDGASTPAFSMASYAYELRPGRRLLFEFSPALLGGDFNKSSISMLLSAQHRWLMWLDLSYGPLNEEGVIESNHRQVLLCLLQGLSEKQIAAVLDLSLFSAHEIVRRLYRRFGVSSRAALMSCWLNGQEKTADPTGCGGFVK